MSLLLLDGDDEAIATSYLDTVLADSPVGLWYLDEASGTTATDQSGNSRNGTYTGSNTKRSALLVQGEQNAVDLTGGYIDVADNAAWSAAGSSGLLTVECWFIADTVSASAQMLVAKHQEWQLRIESNGTLLWDVNANGAASVMSVNPGTTLSTGTLYHVVATYDRAAPLIKMYLNGSSIGTSTSTLNVSVDNSTNLQIGHRSDGGGSTFDGRIGFVALYPTALSASRVSAHYAFGVATTDYPSAISGAGAVQSALVVAQPSNVAGTGTVQTPSIATGQVAPPSTIFGIGTVQSLTGVDVAKPSNISGTGTIHTPTVTAVNPAFPGVITGSGTVQSPTVHASGLAAPSVVIGIGTTFTAPTTATLIALVPHSSSQSVGFIPINSTLIGGETPPTAPTQRELQFRAIEPLFAQSPDPGIYAEYYDVSPNVSVVGTNEFWVTYTQTTGYPGYTVDFYAIRCLYVPLTDTVERSDAVLLIGGGEGTAAVPPLAADPSDQWDSWNNGAFTLMPIDSTHALIRFRDGDGLWQGNTYGDGTFDETIGCAYITIDWDAGTVVYGDWQIIEADETDGESYEFDTGTGNDRRFIRLSDGRVFSATTDENNSAITCRAGDLDADTGDIAWGAKWKHPSATTVPEWQSYNYQIRAYEIEGLGSTTVAVWWIPMYTTYPPAMGKVAYFTIDGSNAITLGDYTTFQVPSHGHSAYRTNFLGYNQYFGMTMTSPGKFYAMFDYHQASTGGTIENLLFLDTTNITGPGPVTPTEPLASYNDFLNSTLEGYGGSPQYYVGYDYVAVSDPFADGSFAIFWDDKTDVVPQPGGQYAVADYWRHFYVNEDDSLTLGSTGAFAGVYGTTDIPALADHRTQADPTPWARVVPLSNGAEMVVLPIGYDDDDYTGGTFQSETSEFYMVTFIYPAPEGFGEDGGFPAEDLFPSETLFPSEG